MRSEERLVVGGLVGGLVDHALDLVVGSWCVGCRRPGRLLCPGCRALLPGRAVPAWPEPVPPDLAPPWAAGPYDGLLRRLVIDHKEEARFGLGVPLGRLLALAVAAAAGWPPSGAAGARAPGPAGPVAPLLLVPVPSRPGVARARGDDPMARLVRVAARTLAHVPPGPRAPSGRGGRGAAVGPRVRVAPMLRSHPGVRDQAGLGAAERARNLAGSMWVPDGALRRVARRTPHGSVVLCDDVLTTGATVREAQRALAAVGLPVAGIATVAAVPRRRPPSVAGGVTDGSPGFLSP